MNDPVDVETIMVKADDDYTGVRGGFGAIELNVAVLTENINLFLVKMETIIEKTPEEVGKFKLSEITVSAEISAEGGLVLIGTGVKAGASGGITFKFARK